MRHLMGFLKADNGTAKLTEKDCWKKSRDIMKHIGYVPGEIDFPDVGTGESFLEIAGTVFRLKGYELYK